MHNRYENQLAIYVGNPPTYLALKNFLLQVENKTGDICGVMDECLHTDGLPYTYGVHLNSVNLGQTGMTLHCYIPGDTGMTLCWTEQYYEKSNNILFRNLLQSFTKVGKYATSMNSLHTELNKETTSGFSCKTMKQCFEFHDFLHPEDSILNWSDPSSSGLILGQGLVFLLFCICSYVFSKYFSSSKLNSRLLV